jgi:hypothetical protein
MTRLNDAASLRGRKRTAADVAGEVTRRSNPAISEEEARQRAAAAEATERRRQVTGHKFRLGERVTLVGRSLDGIVNQDCEVSRLLPPDNTSRGDMQYRVKGVESGQERMVKESQLTGRA